MTILQSAISSSASSTMNKSDAGEVIKRYCFSPDFIGFSGHFPGYPVLPAFIQVMTAISLIEELNGCPLKLATLEKAKFLIQIQPNQEVAVQCREYLAAGRKGWEARLTVNDVLAASFLMFFVEKERAA